MALNEKFPISRDRHMIKTPNTAWRLRDILDLRAREKFRLSVVFDENAFDEVTFRRTGNSTKNFDEVS